MNVTQQTATRLKQAGLPQPTPKPGQFWWTGFDGILYVNRTIEGIDGLFFCGELGEPIYRDWFALNFFVYSPDLDYIAKFLPSGFILEMWNGRHSCKVETDDTEIRTQSDSFLEAAALAYLSLYETV